MNLSLCFWIVFLIYLLLGAWQHGTNWKAHGPNLLLLLLLAILGYAVFGAMVHR